MEYHRLRAARGIKFALNLWWELGFVLFGTIL